MTASPARRSRRAQKAVNYNVADAFEEMDIPEAEPVSSQPSQPAREGQAGRTEGGVSGEAVGQRTRKSNTGGGGVQSTRKSKTGSQVDQSTRKSKTGDQVEQPTRKRQAADQADQPAQKSQVGSHSGEGRFPWSDGPKLDVSDDEDEGDMYDMSHMKDIPGTWAWKEARGLISNPGVPAYGQEQDQSSNPKGKTFVDEGGDGDFVLGDEASPDKDGDWDYDSDVSDEEDVSEEDQEDEYHPNPEEELAIELDLAEGYGDEPDSSTVEVEDDSEDEDVPVYIPEFKKMLSDVLYTSLLNLQIRTLKSPRQIDIT